MDIKIYADDVNTGKKVGVTFTSEGSDNLNFVSMIIGGAELDFVTDELYAVAEAFMEQRERDLDWQNKLHQKETDLV